MTSFRLKFSALLLVVSAWGCGQPAGKPITPPTKEQQAELDKMHAEKKAGSTTPPANK